jgi:hypothetical protein
VSGSEDLDLLPVHVCPTFGSRPRGRWPPWGFQRQRASRPGGRSGGTRPSTPRSAR